MGYQHGRNNARTDSQSSSATKGATTQRKGAHMSLFSFCLWFQLHPSPPFSPPPVFTLIHPQPVRVFSHFLPPSKLTELFWNFKKILSGKFTGQEKSKIQAKTFYTQFKGQHPSPRPWSWLKAHIWRESRFCTDEPQHWKWKCCFKLFQNVVKIYTNHWREFRSLSYNKENLLLFLVIKDYYQP